ncbi:hypothetical protein [Massilia sp. erpn]|uniref:hypothetical protein n=1 Tax=Massilia sp. erpn TaxID=2738142 RepID=UPI002106C07C|nr:hypothetical protein [Massilia sp. erpn]UTY59407.1 hypothetical protein HPQ68_20865 [Massilia sp. erpn]
MRRIFGNPWLFLIFLSIVGAISVALVQGDGVKINQLIAGGLFGLFLGAANLIELFFHSSKCLSAIANGVIGGLAGLVFAYLLEKAIDQMVWYLLGGVILGAAARIWVRHVNF